ncbi:MAG: glycosyltransferase family 4 protein, partial [Aurantibacter sp.]
KKGNYDVVHINTSFNPKSYFRDSIFTLISKMLNYKTIVYWHGWKWGFEKKYAGKIVPYFHFTFGKADAMICLANEFADQLKKYRYSRPIYLETTVVEDQIMQHDEIESSVSNYEIKNILFLSRVEKAKGIYETLDSFNTLINKYPNIKLNIAGTGNELERVKDYVNRQGIREVNFLGWVDDEDKLKVLGEADIFVLASYSEGMPISVLEAMAMGLPVVTTNVGGVKDFFEDGQMGYKVEIGDSGDLKEKLEKLLSNDDLCKRMGNFNKHYALNHFSSKSICERLERIYESVIDRANNN